MELAQLAKAVNSLFQAENENKKKEAEAVLKPLGTPDSIKIRVGLLGLHSKSRGRVALLRIDGNR